MKAFENPTLEQKKEESLQAQVEHFADHGVEDFTDEQKLIFKFSRELSTITDLDNVPEDLPEELQQAIERNKDKYVAVLRSAEKKDIDFRRGNVELYNTKFKAAIDSLKEKISTAHNPEGLPEYLGSGSNGSAYVIEVNGIKYAAKFSRSITQANFETKPLLQAKGIGNTAQLVAYSFPDSVVIMELLPGTDVTKFTPENAPNYSDEHIESLIKKTIELDNRGIAIDPKPSNFIYDENDGFSILDFHLKNPNANYTLADSIMDLRLALTIRDWPHLDFATPEYEKQSLEKSKIYLPMMVRFLDILGNKFPEVVEAYQKRDVEIQADPTVFRPPIIDRRYIQTENPELKPYLAKLEKMGF